MLSNGSLSRQHRTPLELVIGLLCHHPAQPEDNREISAAQASRTFRIPEMLFGKTVFWRLVWVARGPSAVVPVRQAKQGALYVCEDVNHFTGRLTTIAFASGTWRL